MEHYRRVILVAALMVDPDLYDELPEIVSALGMEGPHWQLGPLPVVAGEPQVSLDRLWARDSVFDPNYDKHNGFRALVDRALVALRPSRPPSTLEGASSAPTVNLGLVVQVHEGPQAPPVVHVNVPPAEPAINVTVNAAGTGHGPMPQEQLSAADRAIAILLSLQREGTMPSLRRLAKLTGVDHTTLSRDGRFRAVYDKIREEHEKSRVGRARLGEKDRETRELLVEDEGVDLE